MDKLTVPSVLFFCVTLAGGGVWGGAVSYEGQCGWRWFGNTRPSRMAGGDLAGRNEFPWHVSLQLRHNEGFQSEHFCGGAVLNKRWVLTARRCFDLQRFANMSIDPYKSVVVRAGEHNLNQTESSEQNRLVEEVAYLPGHDIALLKVIAPFTLQPRTVAPICLPDLSDDPPSPPGDCVLAGWGDTNAGPSNLPMSLNMPILSGNECINFGVPFSESICAGYVFEDKGAGAPCWGAMGSPLACRGADGRYYVWGVLTDLTSVSCLPPHTPAVFAEVGHSMKWIEQTIGSEEPPPTPSPELPTTPQEPPTSPECKKEDRNTL
uniref:Serine protease-like protein n=1 Tax=Eriocheir sinensis TaxID=95602 RepID=A0A384S1G4_ERISI|nr:serine protease-like protein [Eriocheir sinensis]